ncbi:MAG TPA: GNAT family N-acetyltransferase [Chitinophagaceae bacterium]|jgi:N-acetylglutamate synthase-like GNAT family acetyltransferase/uncharacterized glyoxalase superfamily protein PhnB|nr:GNAT family N-acetyltransferase [Chitinophagaceae bacterium]
MSNEESADLSLSHVEPVLAVKDVTETVEYWHQVLGFPNKWTWGEPPNHGGVTWQGVFIQFSQQPKLASVSQGNSIFIRVKNVETFYDFHKNKNAEIVEPLENKPWGLAGYTLRDINGYSVVFAGPPIAQKLKTESTPETVRIISRIPTAREYVSLISAVGWDKYYNHSLTEKILAAPVHGVVAEHENQVIGCALILSDEASFYYVKDVMVHPGWQRKHVGSLLMKELTSWLDANAPENAYVGLFTGENLAAFYKQFDFAPVFGMHRSVQRIDTKK